MIIAIDGPAGSGKSTVARQVARALGFHYLDTGAMYRALTVKATRDGLDLSDGAALAALAQNSHISFGYVGKNPLPTQVFIDGTDVTRAIRSLKTDAGVSAVSSHSGVREALVAQQRALGGTDNYVVEGRDIGTVVFPDAELKVFLTASPEVRAARRLGQNKRRAAETSTNVSASAAETLEALVARDRADSTREVSPLVQADDAHLFDTSDFAQEQVVEQILTWARDVCSQQPSIKEHA